MRLAESVARDLRLRVEDLNQYRLPFVRRKGKGMAPIHQAFDAVVQVMEEQIAKLEAIKAPAPKAKA